MESHRPTPGAIVLVPAPQRPARRVQRSLALRLVSLLPALVGTPQRALFTAGLACGLASPSLVRFLADRALGTGLRSLAHPVANQPVRPDEVDEVVVERFMATRIVVKHGKR